MKWPDGKAFAFTVVDDTDGATVENIRPVYELLDSLGLRTTKTVWVEPSRDGWEGESLADAEYLEFVRGLQARGFEIALHGVGSGAFTRQEIIEGLDRYRELLGERPRLHCNHSRSPHNVYWGSKRFVQPFAALYGRYGNRTVFEGEDPGSEAFWGDQTKEIDYIRNFVFNGLDTLRNDRHMPYRDAAKPYSRFWFSSSEGETCADFTHLIAPGNVDALERRGGASIVYTHFASGFVRDGKVDERFAARLTSLSRRNGWFVPASTLLDHLRSTREGPIRPIGRLALFELNARWAVNRIAKRLKVGR